jgi:uncharacterized protein
LWSTPEGWRLRGTAIAVWEDAGPLVASYSVDCDRAWRTRRAEAECMTANHRSSMVLTSDGQGSWQGPGHERVGSCSDVDLAVTPATNTLPVPRLNLKVGDSREVTAAWIRFPGLSVEPLVQSYRRLSRDRSRYESNTGFSAELVVDDLGLDVSYSGAGERIAAR